jgi:hypothetical protein
LSEAHRLEHCYVIFVNKARVAVIAGHTERLAFIEHPSPGPPAGQRSFLVEMQMIDAA